jgi:hypothetical protein
MVGAQGRIRCLPESGVPRRCRSSQTGLLYPFTVSEESPPTLWVSVELLSCVGALVSNFVPRSYKLKEGKKDDQLPPFRLGGPYGESRYGSSAPPRELGLECRSVPWDLAPMGANPEGC